MKRAIALCLAFGLLLAPQSVFANLADTAQNNNPNTTNPAIDNYVINDTISNENLETADTEIPETGATATDASLEEMPPVSEGLITAPNIVTSIDEVDNIKVTGQLPQINNLVNVGFITSINEKIKDSYLSLVNAGYKNITAGYDVYNWGNITSLVVKYNVSKTEGTAAREVVKTFVFDKLSNTEITLRNLLGNDYISYINGLVSAEVAKNPSLFFSGKSTFSSIKSNQSFYISGGKIYIVFDEFSIAPAVSGTPEFVIPFDNTITITLSQREYLLNEEKPYIPLSMVLRLGMDLQLQPGGVMDVLGPDGSIITKINVNNANIPADVLYIDGYDVGISKEFAASVLGINVESIDNSTDVNVSYTFE